MTCPCGNPDSSAPFCCPVAYCAEFGHVEADNTKREYPTCRICHQRIETP